MRLRPNITRSRGAWFALLLAGSAAGAPVCAQDTRLVSVTAGGGNSDAVRELRSGGYELSDGTPLSFRDWYGGDWQDVRALWLTEVTDDFGVYWGFGTGEGGEKYWIDPSVQVGFLWVGELSENAAVSVSALAVLGGRLRERSCMADYGAIGGVQEVNCRLAASPMRPSETLDYLLDEPPANQFRVSVRYQFQF